MDTSFGTVWEHIAAVQPEAVALRSPAGTVSYAEFERRAARLATRLRDAGVGPGEAVALYLYNGPEYLETLFAAFKLGAVPLNVNYRYRGAELTELLVDAAARALVFSAPLAPFVEHAAERVDTLRLLIEVGSSYEDVQRTCPPLPRAERPPSDRLLLYTGGTTGKPKGVIWEHRSLVPALAVATYRPLGKPRPETLADAVDVAVAARAEGSSPRTLPVVPLMHGTGLFNSMGTLLAGGEIVFAGGTSFDPDRTWRSVERYRVTKMLVAGNAIARPLVEALVRGRYDLSSLRTIASSGAVFSDGLKAELHRRASVTIYDALAASEGGPFAFAITSSERDLPARFRPAPGAVVVDAEGRELHPGDDTVGVLAFSGALPLGYHGDPERTAATFREINGVRRVMVGDQVRLEPDGSLRFLGRAGGVINTGGEKVYPAEVEAVLLSHPDVLDVAVVGVPDDTWGERVGAVVALRPGASVDAQALRDWARPHLAGYKLPRRFVAVAELPRTPTGKMELRRARELLLTEPPLPDTTSDPR